ncbi:hypothetical protein Avbf_17752 [Armadillidium vulgare]|nr:hypothetical protein Avbf_17752 [Armadillidium vulgare]
MEFQAFAGLNQTGILDEQNVRNDEHPPLWGC